MNAKPVVDVSRLPTYAFGPRSLMWWGTLGMIVIEGMVFALGVVMYFYLHTLAPKWPPHLPSPDLLFGTINTLVLLLSLLPNAWVKRVAEREELPKVRIGLIICLAFAVAFLVIRIFEFGALNCGWDSNAYGSIVWTLLGLHTAHLLTDALDTAVLTVLMFTGPIEGTRFSDVSDNAFYWYFVVLAWIPLYVVLYFAPRWL